MIAHFKFGEDKTISQQWPGLATEPGLVGSHYIPRQKVKGGALGIKKDIWNTWTLGLTNWVWIQWEEEEHTGFEHNKK